MKKIIIFLTLILIITSIKNVAAKTYSDKFYISDVIDGIYYAKEKDGKVEYRKAKFKRRREDNKIVYCIEPFLEILEDKNYPGYDENYTKILNLSEEQWQRISLLSYYGYGYPGHTEEKWYPITQLLIWETLESEAIFYYTKTFKGEKIEKYEKEINEINELVKNHHILPSFANSEVKMSIDSELILIDENQVLENYKVQKNVNYDIEIINNQLVINSSKTKENIELKLIKKDNLYNNIPVVYVSDTYQNILLVGSYEEINTTLNVEIDSGTLEILKVDADTDNFIPQGEAIIEGTTYELYDENNNFIDKIIINELGQGHLQNLKYGHYRLIETISGEGYKLDQKEYYFNINHENKTINLKLANEVIKSKVKITKYLKNEENLELEKDILFQVFNNKNELISEIVTNELGIAEIELPYGTYTIKQQNTTDGYYKVEDFQVIINENSNEKINYYLNDIKIPNTNEIDYSETIIVILITGIISIGTLLINEKKYI